MELAEEREAQLALRSTLASATPSAGGHPDPALPEPLDAPVDLKTTDTPPIVEPEAAARAEVLAEPALDLELPTPTPEPSPNPGAVMPAEAAIEPDAEEPIVLGLHEAEPAASVHSVQHPEPAQATAKPADQSALALPAEPAATKRRGWWSR